ncbi:MAG: hypothetical protein K8U57_22030 [Planctomycetes bacterium]|nr:hypothetical protein [Planctomycetota bacterium]
MTNDASQSGSLAISVADSDRLNPPSGSDDSAFAEWTPLRDNFTDILLKKKVISLEQLEECERIAATQGLKIQDVLAKLNYATAAECMSAIAEKRGMAFVNLNDVEIPKAIIELVPESVARENMVLPLSLDGNKLTIVTAAPDSFHIVQKLQFILNMDIVLVLAIPEQIQEAINRYYGQSETQSVDSMLVEFTDTAIEFTQTEAKPNVPVGAAPPAPPTGPAAKKEAPETPPPAEPESRAESDTDFDSHLSEDSEEGGSRETVPPKDESVPRGATPPPQAPIPASVPQPAPMAPVTSRSAALPVPRSAPLPPRVAAAKPRSGSLASQSAPAKAKSTTERRATVRYYSRMNPDRVFPLLVMLTRHEVEEVIKKYVEQKATGPLTISKDVPIEIEPVLPGCQCHPPKVTTLLGASDDVFTFHIVPHVLGEVTGARVLIRQDHKMLAEIAVDMRVVQRTLVVASGLSTFVVPAASAAMKHFGLDFTPKDGRSPYLAVLNFLFGEVSPVVLTLALAAVTAGLYWYTRPKGRDVFFDISTKPAK